MNKYDDTDYLIEREESIEYEEKAKRQTENTINYYKNIEKIEEVPIDILRAMYKDMLAELEQDKKRIRESEAKQKEMCEEYCPKIVRIKELEEENADLKIKNNSRIIGTYAEVKLEEILKEDYIPKQKVKDKIEKLRNDIKLGNCRYPYVEEHKIDILQELLGGDEKK